MINEKILKALELAKIPIEKDDGDDFVIRCINPEHEDDNPSLYINKESGLFHCWSCSFSGNIHKLIRLLEVDLSPEDLEDIRLENILRKIKELRYTDEITKTVKEISGTSIAEPWRGISPDLLSSLGIIRSRTLGRIVFPITINGELRGYTMRAIYGQDPKYLHSKNIDFLKLLYPYDHALAARPKTIFLVEGPVDAVRLISHGYSALCIFGTAWGEEKLNLLLTLQPTNVILLFDNDAAGYKIRTTVGRSVSKLFNTYIAKNMNKIGFTDPGDVTAEQMSQLEVVRWR